MEGTIELIEADALKKVPELKGPIDLLFIGAGKQDNIRYLHRVYPKVAPGGIIAALDIVSHAEQVTDYLEKLKTYPDLVTVKVLQTGAGISISYKRKPWRKAP